MRPSRRRVIRVMLAAALGTAVLAMPSPAGATRIVIGGNMEGNIPVSPGDTVRGGWDLSMPGAHPAATVSIATAGVGVSVTCPDGHTQWVGMGFPDQAFTVAANDTSWHPAADSGSPAVWQGSTVAPRDLCHGSTGRSTKGAAMVANVTSSDTVDTVSLRFHYSDGSPGSWSAAKSFQPSASGAPPPTPVGAPPPVTAGHAAPARTLPPTTPAHTSTATARGTAPATSSPSSSAPAHDLTPATGGGATPDEASAPATLQQSVTALQRPFDGAATTTPSTLLGLWSAAGVVLIAVAARWRWHRRSRRG
jgi:hypothetical protein